LKIDSALSSRSGVFAEQQPVATLLTNVNAYGNAAAERLAEYRLHSFVTSLPRGKTYLRLDVHFSDSVEQR
jgi:hypothetical protein